MNANRRSVLIAGLLATAGTIGKAITGSAQSNAGNGGIAGSSADGGTVVVGGGSEVGCVGANGGFSVADASGGDGNVAGPGFIQHYLSIDNTFVGCTPGSYEFDHRGNGLAGFCDAAGSWLDVRVR